nr:pre-peptidase C-terminal domain-containing protein [uncultured Desulfobacter sp.]
MIFTRFFRWLYATPGKENLAGIDKNQWPDTPRFFYGKTKRTSLAILMALLFLLSCFNHVYAAQTLSNGDSPVATIATAGDVDHWTFTASAGDAILVQIAEISGSDFDPLIRLYDPDNDLVTSNYGSSSADISCQAGKGGTYTVEVLDSGSNGTGTYRLYLSKMPGNFIIPSGDEGGALTNGGVHLGTIDVADMDMWTFSGDAQDTIILQLSETSGNSFQPWIGLYGPDGSLIRSGNGGASTAVYQQLTVGGKYTVIVKDYNNHVPGSGDYSLYFASVPGSFEIPEGDNGGELRNGWIHSGRIERADIDMWTFSGDIQNTIILQLSETSGDSFQPWIGLYGPNGNLIGSNNGAATAAVYQQLTVGGKYTVVVKDYNNDVSGSGEYNLYFANVPDSLEIPEGDDGGELSNGGSHSGSIERADIDMWTFIGDVQDTIILQLNETSGDSFQPWIGLYGPDGSRISSNNGADSTAISQQLTVGGKYTVVVKDYHSDISGSGDYTLYFASVPDRFEIPEGDDGGGLSNGGSHSGSIERADIDMWTFSGDAQDMISLQLSETSGDSFLPWIGLYDPSGNLIGSNSGTDAAEVSQQLTVGGKYTVVIKDANNDVTGSGNYELTYNLTENTVTIPSGINIGSLNNGEVVSGHLSVIESGDSSIAEVDKFSLQVKAGEKIRLRLVDITGSNYDELTLQLFRPDGSLVATSTSGGVAQITYTAESSEMLTGFIFNSNEREVDFDLYTAIVPRSYTIPDGDDGGDLSNGTVAGGLISSGDIDFYSLAVAAGDRIHLRLVDITGSNYDELTFQLFRPDGSLVATSTSGGIAQITYTAENTETLTAIIFNSNKLEVNYDLYTAIVPHSYTIPDGDDGGDLSNGTVAGGLISSGDIDFYSLAVAAGDKIHLRLVDITGSNYDELTFQLFRPDGSLVATSTSGGIAEITYIAESTETLTGIIFNSTKAEVDYDLYTAVVPKSYTIPNGDEGGFLIDGTTVSATLVSGDIDLYTMTVSEDNTISVDVTDITGSNYDSLIIKLYDSDGSLIAAATSGSVAEVTYTVKKYQNLTALVFNSGTNPTNYTIVGTAISAPDSDVDRLSDELENATGTDPLNPDSDNDGLSDGDEDANRNGIIDANETNPLAMDTDTDGMPDGWEVAYDLNPTSDDSASDQDSDGFTNLREYIAGTDPIDENDIPYFEAITEDFETGDLSAQPWLTIGKFHWKTSQTNPYLGDYAAESTQIGDDQSSSIEINIYCENGEISFRYAVDSEENSDFLNFYIDGVLYGSWSGYVGYTYASYTVGTGMHNFRWSYEKNDSVAYGADKAWIDEISFPGNVDTDGDSLPDGWEVDESLDYFADDAGKDSDSDLFSNLKEYHYNTDPNKVETEYQFAIGINSDDADTDGKDLMIFINGLSNGVFSSSDIENFAGEFGD